MRSLTIRITSFISLFVLAPASRAASHHDVTIIPLGTIVVKKGEQDLSLRLPTGPRGLLPQPLVLLAAQPLATARPEGPPSPGQGPGPGQEDEPGRQRQVAATLLFTVGGRQLPPWELSPERSAYVIGLDTIRSVPDSRAGGLPLKVALQSEADSLAMVLLGMPDPLLLADEPSTPQEGPLAQLELAAKDAESRAYFAAFADEIAGRVEEARAEYQRLAHPTGNPRVGRLARRGLRMLSYQSRERALSGNYMEHYRWGLYLQFCGLFDAAFKEFEECRILFPDREESQFRAGECLERLGAPLLKHILYMDRVIDAAKTREAARWQTLVIVQRSRGPRRLSDAEITRIKDNWFFMEKIIWATTSGRLQIATSFFEPEDQQSRKFVDHGGLVTGPPDGMIESWGWFDSIVTVRPRSEGEDPKHVGLGGPEIGPKGAAIASVFHDAQWPQYLRAIYAHVYSAAETAEAESGLPGVDDALDCGIGPVPHEGAAYRAALRYHFGRESLARLDLGRMKVPGSFLNLWQIEGPWRIPAQPPKEELPPRHVMNPIPADATAETRRIVHERDFVDLAALMPDAGWAVARATTWIYSPSKQEVRLGVGRNDGAALWLNGRRILAGRHYATGKFEDRNLVDTVLLVAGLESGWNELVVVVESWPPPRNKRWGFSVSITAKDGELVPGLACVNRPPSAGLVARDRPPLAQSYYSWSKVKHDFRRRLPNLSALDLQVLTGVRGLEVRSEARPFGGYVALVAPGRSESATYRIPPKSRDNDRDRDVLVNNVMDWAREACAAFRYRAGDQPRDLLLIKPEAVEAFLTLLAEPESAAAHFKGLAPADRVLGYVLVPVGASTRSLLAVDGQLGDRNGWPLDEEDLLAPLGEFVPNFPEAEADGPQSSSPTPPAPKNPTK